MNDATHAALSAYIGELAGLLGLRDWVVTLHRTVDETGQHRAEITLHRQKDEAQIALSEAWFGRTREQQRHTIVHELLHCQTARLCRVVTRLSDQIGSEVLAYVERAHDEEEEIVVERLARVLAPMMPLPPELA